MPTKNLPRRDDGPEGSPNQSPSWTLIKPNNRSPSWTSLSPITKIPVGLRSGQIKAKTQDLSTLAVSMEEQVTGFDLVGLNRKKYSHHVLR